MGNVNQHVIARLRDLGFAPPSRVTPEKLPNFFNEYIDCLSGFNDDVLIRAMDEIRLNCKFWPTIAEVYAACKKHVPAETYESPNWGEEAKETPTTEQVANVRRMAALFRESVRPMYAPTIAESAEKLKDTPYQGVFKTDRKTFLENDRRWREAEKI